MASAPADRKPPTAEASLHALNVKEEPQSTKRPLENSDTVQAQASTSAPATDSQRAELLYERCSQSPVGTVFFQRDLSNMDIAEDMSQLAKIISELVDRHLMKLMTFENEPCWKLRTRQEAETLRLMSGDERLIYHMIDAEQNKGVWSQAVRARTSLSTQTINKILKGLETKGLVQSVLSVKNPNRRMYLLKHLRPAEDIAGGPWQSEGEFDAPLIEAISRVVEHKLRKDTCVEVPADYNDYAKADREGTIARKKAHVQAVRDIEDNPPLRPYMPPFQPKRTRWVRGHNPEYPTISSLREYVDAQNVIRDKSITDEDMEQLLEMMVLEGRLEKVSMTSYRLSMASREVESYNGFVDAPCGNCPVFEVCADEGEISARTCVYFGEWLQTDSEEVF